MMKLLKASALIAAGLIAGVVIAQQVKPDRRAIFEAVQAMSAPAPEHRNLDPLVGTFSQEIEYEAGGGAPVLVEGVATGQWVLGKRFVQLNAKADSSEEVKFESIGFFGYDTQRKKYTAIGLDTGGTYAVFAEGDYDAASKTWTLFGERERPGVGKSLSKFVLRVMPDGSISHEVFLKVPDAPDYSRVARTVYKRK